MGGRGLQANPPGKGKKKGSIRFEKERKFWDRLKWESSAEIRVMERMEKLPAVNVSFKKLYRTVIAPGHQRGSENR